MAAVVEMRAGSVMEQPIDFDTSRAFDDHGSVLLGFAVNALRDRALAEDCVQETFLRAWRSRDRFDPHRASERTWLFAIARNVVADALRARARLGRIGSDALLEQQPSTDRDPLERLRIVEGLSRLSDAHREVVVAVHLDGRSYQELADATGTPVATLRTRAFHALRALRGHLEGSDEPDAQS
ncbi:sigma-70 family RNA polymerase sigma factor [Microbacterium sp. Gd 4-13]|uniref:RNA polymerase sigma factor n=1 Tax=Microbacterium sp. Gd 4-13 TaxID=2173179 RepID=UPI001F0C5A0F|nr:sigma-70 family RNA polymerase sigma factor [Microbacterium sp. Gd 4-13]